MSDKILDCPPPATRSAEPAADFAQIAARRSSGLLGEFIQFLAHSGKWWLLPIVLVLLTIGVLIVLSSTALAPFIYTLF